MAVVFTELGGGKLRYRVVIDGCPYQPVSTKLMQTSAHPNIGDRFRGLVMSDVTFTQKADPVQCKLQVGGFELKLIDFEGVWSRVFDLPATEQTWLAANLSATDTTATVETTASFASSGYLWIDGETIAYGNKTPTTFTGLTRGGILSDDTDSAQAHYITDGDTRRTPAITNWPVMWEGRRVVVYRYEEDDAASGTGTQIYRGQITTAPRFDGKTWTLGVDHMSSVLDQTFGGDLGNPLPLRGIHYTSQSPLVINWTQHSAVAGSYAAWVAGTVTLTGFWERQEDFCNDATTGLTKAFFDSFSARGGLGTVTAISEGASGWHLQYKTDAASSRELLIQIVSELLVPIDPPLGSGPPDAGGFATAVPANTAGLPQNAIGHPVGYAATGTPLATDTTYYFYRPMNGETNSMVATPLGSVPRGAFSYSDDAAGRTLYIGESGAVSADTTSVMVKGKDLTSGNDFTETYGVESVDTTNRTVTIASPFPAAHWFVSDPPLEVRLGLALQNVGTSPLLPGASVADMLDYVTANRAQFQCLGVLPDFRSEDYDSAAWHVIFDPLGRLNTQRIFTTFSPVSLNDIVREELKAAGCFLALDLTGRLIPARIYLPPASQFAATATIDAGLLLTDKARVTHEVSGFGQVNQVTFQTGFDAESGKFNGPTYTTRDVSAYGQNPSVREMGIAQKSQLAGPPLQFPDYVNAAAPIFGALSGEYAVDTIDAAKSQAVQLGSAVTFDCPYLWTSANATGIPAGQRGVLGRIGLVLGKEWGAYSPRTRFTVLNTKQLVGGYAPGAIITGTPVNTGGNTWDIDLDSSYFPGASVGETWFKSGYAIQIIQWNASSALTYPGTVNSAVGNSVEVDLGAVWTPGASTWYLTFDASSAVGDEQMRFAFIADSLRDTENVDFPLAKVFAS